MQATITNAIRKDSKDQQDTNKTYCIHKQVQ